MGRTANTARNQFGKDVDAFRKMHGWSLKKFAEEAGVDYKVFLRTRSDPISRPSESLILKTLGVMIRKDGLDGPEAVWLSLLWQTVPFTAKEIQNVFAESGASVSESQYRDMLSTIYDRADSLSDGLRVLLNRPLTPGALADYCSIRFPHKSCNEQTLCHIIASLDRVKYQTIADIDRVIGSSMPECSRLITELGFGNDEATNFVTVALAIVDEEYWTKAPWDGRVQDAILRARRARTNRACNAESLSH